MTWFINEVIEWLPDLLSILVMLGAMLGVILFGEWLNGKFD